MAAACAQGGGKKSSPAPAGNATGTDGNATAATATATGTVAGATTDPSKAQQGQPGGQPQAYFTGFDGANPYSILLSGDGTYTVADPSIAKIEDVQVNVTGAEFQKLQQALQAACPQTDAITINQMMAFFGQAMQRPMHRLTALKAGTTTINFAPPADQGDFGGGHFGGGQGGQGGQGGHQGGGQGSGTTVGTPCKPDFQTLRAFGGYHGHHKAATINLTVNQYSAAQVQAGQQRYYAALDASNPACADCHVTGTIFKGAPSHALGDVSSISDADVATWITTGVLGKRSAQTQAHIPHAWKFADDNQKAAVVAYLRSLATGDAESLLVDQFNLVFGVQLDASIVTGAPSSTGNGAGATTTTTTGAATGATTTTTTP